MNERAIPVQADIEFRSTDTGHHFTGYAALFDTPSAPFPSGMVETIAPGFFQRALGDPSRKTFVIDHDPFKLLASTTGTEPLKLGADSRGLFTEADLPDTSYVRDLRELHDRGETSGMSFEFSVSANGQQRSKDGKSRRLVGPGKLYHVTILQGLEPRYPGTMAELRSLADAVSAEPEEVEAVIDALREQRRLTTDEWALFDKLTVAIRPEETEVRAATPILTPNLEAARALLSAR